MNRRVKTGSAVPPYCLPKFTPDKEQAMLGRIILHGLVAVLLVAGAAATYAAASGQPPAFHAEGEDD
ncbi:MAG: hypothetical protein NVV74_18405 [Magnetospirillum sp.]|nr:hypothetical protein [Magnetospirillum sp.]